MTFAELIAVIEKIKTETGMDFGIALGGSHNYTESGGAPMLSEWGASLENAERWSAADAEGHIRLWLARNVSRRITPFQHKASLDAMAIRQIACDPEVMSDPRTVRREITLPGSVRGSVGERIRRKLVAVTGADGGG